MFGTCKDCDVDNLALYPNEEEGTLFAIVCWKCFCMEKVVIKKGKEKIKIKLMHILETNSMEFITF
jgi:hypothetical protein